MRLSYTKKFSKSYNKQDKKIQSKFDERVLIFKNNPTNPILHNHKLFGAYQGYRSINITGDYRVIFREYPDGSYEFVEFVDIGSHSQLYS